MPGFLNLQLGATRVSSSFLEHHSQDLPSIALPGSGAASTTQNISLITLKCLQIQSITQYCEHPLPYAGTLCCSFPLLMVLVKHPVISFALSDYCFCPQHRNPAKCMVVICVRQNAVAFEAGLENSEMTRFKVENTTPCKVLKGRFQGFSKNRLSASNPGAIPVKCPFCNFQTIQNERVYCKHNHTLKVCRIQNNSYYQ